jgi:hypothetical protein
VGDLFIGPGSNIGQMLVIANGPRPDLKEVHAPGERIGNGLENEG